jgi:predicted amidohydrolase
MRTIAARTIFSANAGLSVIAAPDGTLLATADNEAEALLIADIRPDDFAASAIAVPYLRAVRL